MKPDPDWANMDDEEFAEHLVPNSDDLRTAGAWLVHQTKYDIRALAALFVTTEQHRQFHLDVALAETAIRATGLRDRDPDLLPQLIEDLLHAPTTDDDPEGDTP